MLIKLYLKNKLIIPPIYFPYGTYIQNQQKNTSGRVMSINTQLPALSRSHFLKIGRNDTANLRNYPFKLAAEN